jgi:arabinofuranosyltransferase
VIRPVLQAGVKSASERSLVGVLVTVALAWTGYLSWFVIHQPEEFVLTDDAYISLRYAQNWVNGAGIVWQPGDRVEGYTNFLQVALFASGLRLGLSGELVGYTVGLVSALASLVVAALIARRLSTSEQDNGWAGGIAAVLIGANPFFAYWSMSGLETPLFILFCLLSVWAFYETLSAGLSDGKSARLSRAVPLGVALIGAAMTRPDGLILAFAVAAVAVLAIWHTQRHQRALLNLSGVAMAVFAIGYGTYFAWRLWYYGQLLPNTFYVKVGSGMEQIRRGIVYAWDMLNLTPVHIPLVIGVTASVIYPWRQWLSRSIMSKPQHLTKLLLLTFILLYSLYLIYIGGDAFGIRMAMVVVATCAILADHTTVCLLSQIKSSIRHSGIYLILIISVLILAYSSIKLVSDNQTTHVSWKRLGIWLRDNASPDSVIAVDAAGAIPYFSGLRSIDMLGLNNRHIAHIVVPTMGSGKPGHEKYDARYVYAQNPDWIASWIKRDGTMWFGLSRWPERERYSLHLVVQSRHTSLPWYRMVDESTDVGALWDAGYTYGLWKRNDRLIPQYLEVNLQAAPKNGLWDWRPWMMEGTDYWFSNTPGSLLTLEADGGATLAIVGLCHNWSGMLEVFHDGSSTLISVLDFYNPTLDIQCVHRVEVPGEATERIRLRLMVSPRKNSDSASTEIFINRVLILKK